MCKDSIVLPPGRIAIILFDIITGAIVGVIFFAKCTFAPESAIYRMLLLGVLGGVSIKFIKLILVLPISVLLIAACKCRSHPFSLTTSIFLY